MKGFMLIFVILLIVPFCSALGISPALKEVYSGSNNTYAIDVFNHEKQSFDANRPSDY